MHKYNIYKLSDKIYYFCDNYVIVQLIVTEETVKTYENKFT